jgi:hypothetical protein
VSVFFWNNFGVRIWTYGYDIFKVFVAMFLDVIVFWDAE